MVLWYSQSTRCVHKTSAHFVSCGFLLFLLADSSVAFINDPISSLKLNLYQLITNSSLTPLYIHLQQLHTHHAQHKPSSSFFFFVHHNHHPYGTNPASHLQDLNGGAGNPTRRRTD